MGRGRRRGKILGRNSGEESSCFDLLAVFSNTLTFNHENRLKISLVKKRMIVEKRNFFKVN